MKHRTGLASLLLFACVAGCGDETLPGNASASTSSSSSSGGDAGVGDPSEYLNVPLSCAYECPNDKCAERETPYACPSLAAWDAIPHLDACPKWDGTYPTPQQGACTASAPALDAIKRPGFDPSDPTVRLLPGGRRTKPAGKVWDFDEVDTRGGTTTGLALVAGTPYALAVDTGNDDHAVRAVDLGAIGSGAKPVSSIIQFKPPSTLNSTVISVSPNRAYVATGYGVVQALAFDATSGLVTRDDAASLTLPPLADNKLWYASGITASPDGKLLVVSSVTEKLTLVYDIDPLSPSYLQKLGEVDIGVRETFGAWFDYHDPTGHYVYVTAWNAKQVVEIDVSNPATPVVSRTFATGANPQGVAFLDARWMAVANDYGETLSLVDRVSAEVTAVPIDYSPGLHGLDVSAIAWDEAQSRLYAVLSGINAIAAYQVDLAASPPAFTPIGRLPTAWWPSAVAVGPGGGLTVVNMRGRPIGPLDEELDIGGGDGDEKMRGSIQQIPAPSAADLDAGEVEVDAAVAVGKRPGYPTLSCPVGVMDFPVPPTNTMGASPHIVHVFFIVRENKTFDALMGDLPNVDGDPALAMKSSTAEMDQIWPNFRNLARDFTVGDNFYNVAVKSTQGHQWTTYGRTTDFCERTWSDDLRPVPLCGITDVGRPVEGSLFEWLGNNNVVYDILGEIVGTPGKLPATHNPIDVKYPGGPFQNITYNDLPKACYTSARVRVACDLGTFVYMTLPNDHTVGVSPTNPTPETMCAINDEATGMFVDALSHSPIWASSLVVITEDDPQQGGDHVDYHRTPLVVISPWAKRGYVSRTHIDVASLHKLFSHILGVPYPNLIVQNAGLPLDMFTSTPDFTPFDYVTHKWPIGCGTGSSAAEKRLTDSWDFDQPDTQAGLGDQVMRWMRGRQLTQLPPRIEAQIAARNARRAAGLPPVKLDDDDD